MIAGATVTLKPCPFCGGEAALIPTVAGSMTLWQAHCEWDGCGAKTLKACAEDDAARAWNTRATAAEFAAREAALVEALERIAAPALVSLDELPNGWRGVAVERIDIARAALARAHTTSEAPDA